MQANQQLSISTDRSISAGFTAQPKLSTRLIEALDLVQKTPVSERESVTVEQISTRANTRWRDLASRQGFGSSKAYRLTGVAKVYELKEDPSHLHLFVVAPYLAPTRDYFAGRIGFEISIAKTDITFSDDHEGVDVGDLITFFPERLSNHAEPSPSFLTDTLIVLGRSAKYNPFAFADVRSFPQLVTDSNGRVIIAMGRLINLLAFFYELLDEFDQQLIFDLMIGLALLNPFLTQPASTCDHHAYAHGLAVHAVETILQALVLMFNGGQGTLCSLRITILMAWLHDIGKCTEYLRYGINAFQLSDSGIWAGHTSMGGIIVSHALLNQSNYCQLRKLKLINCITAVPRGSYPSGARGRLTQEAIRIHSADCLSASGKLNSQVVAMMRTRQTDTETKTMSTLTGGGNSTNQK